jgi:exodeoxyribonuclease VII large subunit
MAGGVMADPAPAAAGRVWSVGALCQAVADALDARFSPVTVVGEITGFSRPSSGHCYFALKDGQGQLRCALFRRSAGALAFAPRDGEQVEVSGRLTVYGPRGDLQLVVDSMRKAGQGVLFEQFLRLKARLEAEGLFDAARKQPLPAMPRAIGLVTSLGAAALHDVATALRRRVPHIPVRLAPAAVQGGGAPAELVAALESLYGLTPGGAPQATPVDVILLVRGGGAIEDLWAFNDEALARCIARSPVPLVCGVGHETDFTIADFVADVRAPTPTAAAELVAPARAQSLDVLAQAQRRLQEAVERRLDLQAQRLDTAASRLGRPSARLSAHQMLLQRQAQRLRQAVRSRLERLAQGLDQSEAAWPAVSARALARAHDRLERSALRLSAVDPQRVLERGYAWLSDEHGHAMTRAAGFAPDQPVRATLADGTVDLRVTKRPKT